MEGKVSKCPICFELLHDKSIASPDICNHNFCLPCLLEWSKRGTFCPVDRKRFKKIVTSDKVIPIKPRKRKKQYALYDVSVYCEKCKNDKGNDTLILCDCCDLAYHCDCLDPPLSSIPPGQWFCPDCEAVAQKLRMKKSNPKKVVPIDSAKSKKAVIEPKPSTSAVSNQDKPNDDFAVRKEIRRNNGKGIEKHYSNVVEIVVENKKSGKAFNGYRPSASVRNCHDWASNNFVGQKEIKKIGSNGQTVNEDILAVDTEDRTRESFQLTKNIFSREMNSFLSMGKARVSGGSMKPASENLEDFFSIHEDNSITKSKPWMQTQNAKQCTTSSDSSIQEPAVYDSNAVGRRLRSYQKGHKQNEQQRRTNRLAAITCKKLLKDLNKDKSSENSSTDEDSINWSVFDKASVSPKENHTKLSGCKIPLMSEKSRGSSVTSQILEVLSGETGIHKLELSSGENTSLPDESCGDVNSRKIREKTLRLPDATFNSEVKEEELPLQNLSQCDSTHGNVIPIIDISLSPEPEPTDETFPENLEKRTDGENASQVNENNVSTQFSVFEKLDNTLVSSQKYSNINMAVCDKYQSSKKTFITPHKHLSSLESSESSGSLPEIHILSKTQTSLANTISNQRSNDSDKSPLDNFKVRQVHYAIKAKMNLPTELKRIEQEKWRSKPYKSLNKYKLKSSCSNRIEISSVRSISSASKQHIVSQTIKEKNSEVYGADILENGNGSIENHYEYRSIKKDFIKHNDNTNDYFHSVNTFNPVKMFSLEEYNISQFTERPVCNNIPRNILKYNVPPNNLKHLDIREDGRLFLNWKKSSS